MRSRSESQRSVFHELATSPRSTTTWSTPRSLRQRLIARPLWPPPMTTVVADRAGVGAGLGRCSAGQLTTTVTFVGLVTMSYTAERFCDCATIASMSSAEASASMS